MKLVILDRDGVINENRDDYVKSPEELILLPGSAPAVARLNRADIKVAVVSNQAAIGRGIIDQAMLTRIHDKLNRELLAQDARLDLILHCPDPPWAASDRRKPGPGMLREALEHFGAAAEDTPMIGDDIRDLQAAVALGCPRVLVRTGHGTNTLAAGLPATVQPVSVHDNLAAAVEALLAIRP